jgi:hypothetical protein
MQTENLYPYLMLGLPGPDFEAVSLPVGHGLCAVLCEDVPSGDGVLQKPVTAGDLTAANLTAEQAHGLALDNLTRFALTDEMPPQPFGGPGRDVHFLLYSDHRLAAACLRAPPIYEEAREHLGTAELCACVPQQQSLVVFAKRDRAFRERVLAVLRQAEADAEKPLNFGLFELSAAGVRPFEEPPS